MKVVIYKNFVLLNKCKKLIEIYNDYHIFSYCFIFIKNGFIHNEKSYAAYDGSKERQFFFKGECYGNNNDFTICSWNKKVKELKYLESLEIFK